MVGDRRAVVVRKALNAGVFNIGQPPELVTHLIPFIMSTGGGGQGRGHPGGTKNGVPHTGPAFLVIQNFHTIKEAINFFAVFDALQRICSKEKTLVG